MLATTLFFQTLTSPTEDNFKMAGRRRHLKPVSSVYIWHAYIYAGFKIAPDAVKHAVFKYR